MSWTKTYWRAGDWNAICQVCGFKFKASQLSKRWDGLYVCKEDWEVRHPQELIKPIKDMQKLPWTSPKLNINDEQFINTCTLVGSQGVAGLAVAGCAVTGKDLGARNTTDMFPSTYNQGL